MGGAVIIAVAQIFSRLTGLVRDNLLASTFGASATADVYNAAFEVPEFIFNILVLGALSASFIPVFIQVKEEYGRDQAFASANAILNILVIALTSCAALGIVFAPQLSYIIAHTRSADQQLQIAHLMQVMFLSVIFFGISNVFSGILHSYRSFLAYAFAPILYNFGIIAGIVWLYPLFGVMGLGYGVVLGAALHCMVQIPSVWRTGFRYRWVTQLSLPGVKKILTLMPPRALALGIVKINTMVTAILVLLLPAGSLAVWTYADNLQNLPINVFGVSLALSSFPVFSQAFAEKDLDKFKQMFSTNFRRILFLIVPVTIGILLLRAQIVRLAYGRGEFDWAATITTAQVLGIFAVAMFSEATIPLLARSFFAHNDTKTTVYVSLCTMTLNISLAWILLPYFGIYGLAFAFAATSLLNMTVLLLILRVKFGDLDDRRIVRSVWRITLASGVMGLIVLGAKYFIAPLVDMHTVIGIALQTLGSTLAGGLVYVAIAVFFRFEEVEIIRDYLKKVRRLVTSS